MTVIVKTIKAATQSNFKKLLEYIYADFDRFTVMFLTVSVFMPFYFTIASVCIVSVMIMVNCKKRTKAFSGRFS